MSLPIWATSLPIGIILQFCVGVVVPGVVSLVANALTKFLVDDYKQILVIGCEEASKWSTSEPTLHVHTNLELAKLEEELQIRGQSIHVWIFALVHQCL
jgi:hypothetical protein